MKLYLLVLQFMSVPSSSTVAYIVGAEAVSRSQPCMTSYFKGGVES